MIFNPCVSTGTGYDLFPRFPGSVRWPSFLFKMSPALAKTVFSSEISSAVSSPGSFWKKLLLVCQRRNEIGVILGGLKFLEPRPVFLPKIDEKPSSFFISL